MDYERENYHIRLGVKHIKSHTELALSGNEKNNELQTRIENVAGQGFGLFFEKIISCLLTTKQF